MRYCFWVLGVAGGGEAEDAAQADSLCAAHAADEDSLGCIELAPMDFYDTILESQADAGSWIAARCDIPNHPASFWCLEEHGS